MNHNIKTYQLNIEGRVQNVGFRYWFNLQAINLDLKGYVKNLDNKNEVESLVQGQFYNILNIIEKSKKGPKLSIVDKIKSKEITTSKIYTKFIIC